LKNLIVRPTHWDNEISGSVVAYAFYSSVEAVDGLSRAFVGSHQFVHVHRNYEGSAIALAEGKVVVMPKMKEIKHA